MEFILQSIFQFIISIRKPLDADLSDQSYLLIQYTWLAEILMKIDFIGRINKNDWLINWKETGNVVYFLVISSHGGVVGDMAPIDPQRPLLSFSTAKQTALFGYMYFEQTISYIYHF